jgi:hypothetical protein
MADEAGIPESARWLLDPPAAGEVKVHLAIGDGYEITDEVNAAIEALLQALQTEEVEGFRNCNPKCKGLSNCGGEGQAGFGCMGHGNCTFLDANPCARFVSCVIAPTTPKLF